MHISLYLPTATGDFSGACSALHTLDCGVVVLDPKGCAGDYLMVEDPRLPDGYDRVRSIRMDDVDVSMGDYSRASEMAQAIIARHHPSFLALVGTTVSSIIGLDVALIAAELEDELGLPVLPVDTDGFTSYAQGIHAACQALIERFGEAGAVRPRSVNVLGMTPVDFRSEHDQACVRAAVERCGCTVLGDGCMGLTLEQVAAMPQAAVNLAVSAAGLETARWMQEEYGTPYVAYAPVNAEDGILSVLLEATLADGVSRLPEDYFALEQAPQGGQGSGGRALIVADEVLARSLRAWLHAVGYTTPIELATFFATGDTAPAHDVHYLQGDLALLELQQREEYHVIVGDPLLERIPALRDARLLSLPHPALSSLLYRSDLPTFAADDPWFAQLLAGITESERPKR